LSSLISRSQFPTSAQQPIDLIAFLFHHYSRCKLTVETDKLVALQGVVALFEKHYNIRLYGGIIDGFLHRSLMWYRDTSEGYMKPSSSLKRIKELNLPSWTWAAYDGTISFFDPPASLGLKPMRNIIIQGDIEGSTFSSPKPMTLSAPFTRLRGFGSWGPNFQNNLEIEDKHGREMGVFYFDQIDQDPGQLTGGALVMRDDASRWVLALLLKANEDETRYCRVGIAVVQTKIFMDKSDRIVTIE
jgi:hypothetical protein